MPGSGDRSRQIEAFPPLDPSNQEETSDHALNAAAQNRSTASPSLSDRLRRVSQSFEQAEIPEGFSAATGGLASSLLSRQTAPRPASRSIGTSKTQPGSLGNTAAVQGSIQSVPEETQVDTRHDSSSSRRTDLELAEEPTSAAPFANGYHFPPKHSFGESLKLGANSFWSYVLTPVGFLVTLYGLNVVAWGGMLFLLLCNASPAMCHPTCDDINSPRRIWIEIDSQILNALFCITGFGLAPWRFRDLYFLLQYRLAKKAVALRRLAGIHRGWFRLRHSNELPSGLSARIIDEYELQPHQRSAIPFPDSKLSDPPLTGTRAPPTKLWKLDLVIWLMVANTVLQCVLCGFMWGMNRYDRPSWSTGLFVALGCIAAAAGGFIMFLEGKAVKGIEGVPLSQKDLARLERDRKQGVWHFNNIRDKNTIARNKQNSPA